MKSTHAVLIWYHTSYLHMKIVFCTIQQLTLNAASMIIQIMPPRDLINLGKLSSAGTFFFLFFGYKLASIAAIVSLLLTR